MKRCPQCGRDYTDETLNFCLEDGEWLISADESATAILTEAELPSESPTRPLIASKPSTSNTPSSKRRWIIVAMVCLATTAALCVVGYLYFLRGNSREIDSIAVALSSIKVDPLFDPLRDDPRFMELLKKVGLPE